MDFQPDYRHMLCVLSNHRPDRLPIYEHVISPVIMEKILGISFAELQNGDDEDLKEFFSQYCRFYKQTGYDTVSFSIDFTSILPGHGAIRGGKPGPIQTRQDFEKYPWDQLPAIFWQSAERKFEMLGKCLPEGMKAIGGIGNGVFEISEDLAGLEYLSYMLVDNPPLVADLYRKIGDLMLQMWEAFLCRFGRYYAVCRFGDDLGFKTGTLVSPSTIKEYIIPQYRRIIPSIHSTGKPFLWHSCGNIFEVMDAVIETGIDAKHSNEDAIAPFDRWISLYGERIALLGGIDINLLCQGSPSEIAARTFEDGLRFRSQAKGYALGSGNSIPDYVPVEGYLAMLEGARKIREYEQTTS